MQSFTPTKPQPLTAETVLKILREQPDFFQQYKIKTLALFGSTARNQATENSDLDFLVEFIGTSTFDGYMDLLFYLEDLFKRPVDLVTEKALRAELRPYIDSEKIYV
ncbi:MAG: nucleotidyltransferase family protein [Cyanobacteria bacterium]|nr:nucleotidyltransferase family protein [Cyanobacteriota bacterium]